METQTLKEKEENQQLNHQTTTLSFPNEIIQEIFSRLPIKPILQFKSVSKQWLFLISHDPSFPKLHFNRSLATNRTALFITAYDTSTRLRHILSAPLSGGHVTHLMTLNNAHSTERATTEAEHLRGLVLYTSANDYLENNSFAFIINPATRNIYKLPVPDQSGSGSCHMCYFFGFDELNNEHKVFSIRMPGLEPFCSSSRGVVTFMIFSLSDYSWRKVDVGRNLPLDFNGHRWFVGIKSSVCVNSVIHVMLHSPMEILAFDLRTETFEIIKVPDEALAFVPLTRYTSKKGKNTKNLNIPVVMKVDGLLGVFCHDRVAESNEMYLWVLEDYENRVWVRKTISFFKSWVDLDGPFPSRSGNSEEILFYPKRPSRNMMSVPVFDLKTGSFKSVKYFLGYPFLRPKTVKFDQVTSYIESVVPLVTNEDIHDLESCC